MLMFFSIDGAIGSAESRDLLIVDCAEFTDADWQEIEEATDNKRMATAFSIASRYRLAWSGNNNNNEEE